MKLELFWVITTGAALLGCGAKVVYVTADGGGDAGGGGVGGGAPLSCESVVTDFDAPVTYCIVSGSQCELTGMMPDGARVVERCESGEVASCSLSIDGEDTCTCPPDRIDWANTCPNGVPTCQGWQFNWATAEPCPVG
ncbi:MAG: hypothetical protein U0271_19760 [Polyangiaceae bacterium]